MRLYLVRHGRAAKTGGEPEASLTQPGADEVERVSAFLARLGDVAPAEIRHSTKLRARQTAEIVAERLGISGRLEEVSGLAPNDPVADLAAEILVGPDDLMLVSHLPILDRLASLLVADSDAAEAFAFPPSGVLCLARTDGATRDSRFSVRWMIRPDLLRD